MLISQSFPVIGNSGSRRFLHNPVDFSCDLPNITHLISEFEGKAPILVKRIARAAAIIQDDHSSFIWEFNRHHYILIS